MIFLVDPFLHGHETEQVCIGVSDVPNHSSVRFSYSILTYLFLEPSHQTSTPGNRLKNRSGHTMGVQPLHSQLSLLETVCLPLICASGLPLGTEVCVSFAGMPLSPGHWPFWYIRTLFLVWFGFFFLSAWLYEILSRVAVCWLRLGHHHYCLSLFWQIPIPSHGHLGSLESLKDLF